MLDFDKLPRFTKDKFEIITMTSEWAYAYQVDPEAILRQIAIAHAWCESNKKLAPRKNVVRFLHNWLRLAKKHGNLVAQHKTYQDTTASNDMSVAEMIAIRKANFR